MIDYEAMETEKFEEEESEPIGIDALLHQSEFDQESDISDRTGFDAGDKFHSPAHVRAYFRRDELLSCFHGEELSIPDQEYLDYAAQLVIEHRWHCRFTPRVERRIARACRPSV